MMKEYNLLPRHIQEKISPAALGGAGYISADFWLPPEHHFEITRWPDVVPILDAEEGEALPVDDDQNPTMVFSELVEKHFIDPRAAIIVMLLLDLTARLHPEYVWNGTREYIWNETMADLDYVVIFDREES